MEKLKYPNGFINKIINANCLSIMKDIPDKSIDLVLTDPPYGIFSDKKQTGFQKNVIIDKSVNQWDDRIEKEYFDEIFRISKNQIIWGLQYYIDYLKPTKEIIVWDKKTGANYFADGEAAYTSFSGTLRIFRHQWCGAFKDSERGIRNLHPTQKPLKLFTWCIKKYTNENDIICDPFAGSGTTAVACYETNRRYICIEKEKKYVDISVKRIKQKKECYSLLENVE